MLDVGLLGLNYHHFFFRVLVGLFVQMTVETNEKLFEPSFGCLEPSWIVAELTGHLLDEFGCGLSLVEVDELEYPVLKVSFHLRI